MDDPTLEEAEAKLESSPRSASQSTVRAALWAFSGASFLIVAFVIWMSRLLRPMADDYSIGVSVRDGLIAGVWGWWQGWSGDLTSMFANTLFVGLPLMRLPWSLASALPFLASAAMAVGLGVWLIIRVPVPSMRPSSRLVSGLLLIPVAAIAWWGYWWVTVLQSREAPNAYPLAQGVTFWQNLNAGYVVTATLLIWGWLILESRKVSRRLWPFYLAVGLLAGFNGPVFAGSALVMIALLAVSSLLRAGIRVRERGVSWLIAGLGIVVGGVASNLSPGSQYRGTLLASPEIDANLMLRLTGEAIPGGLNDWWSAVTSPGAWAVIILLTGTTALLARQGWTPNLDYFLTTGAALLAFSLILSLVSRASEFFAYPAYWHLVQPRTVAWLGLVMIAAALGTLTSRLGQDSLAVPVTVTATAVALVLAAASIALMTSEILARGQAWETGPAPLAHVSDIEDPNGWQRAAWTELRQLRGGGPLRGVE
jgi:hypothetical protein